MKNQKQVHSALDEIAVLKEKFNNIKVESEEFVAQVKKLSDSGMQEAAELLESAKLNWHSLTNSLGGLKEIFSKSKKPTSTQKKATAASLKTSKKISTKKISIKKVASSKKTSRK